MDTILKVENLNVYYGSIHAIKGVSFEVKEGEIVTLIGANGAGKSTTLNTISGLLHSRDRLRHLPGQGPCPASRPTRSCRMGLALVPGGTAGLPADDRGRRTWRWAPTPSPATPASPRTWRWCIGSSPG